MGHRRPGESINSRYGVTRNHVVLRVTPGISAVLMVDFPLIRLIRVDFPTLGTPTTIARTVFLIPRF